MRTILSTRINRKGFTIAELMMVVGIIAIVVGVSVPTFASQVSSNRRAMDTAAYNAAISAAIASYYSTGLDCSVVYYYDASTGRIIKSSDSATLPDGYGESTGLDWKGKTFNIGALSADNSFSYPKYEDNGRFMAVIFKDNKGTIDMTMTGWVKRAVTSPYTNSN